MAGDLTVEVRDEVPSAHRRRYRGGRLAAVEPVAGSPVPADEVDLVVEVPGGAGERVGRVPLAAAEVVASRVRGRDGGWVPPYPARVVLGARLDELPCIPGLDLVVRYDVLGTAFGDVAWVEQWCDGRRARCWWGGGGPEPDVGVAAVVHVLRPFLDGSVCPRSFLQLGGGLTGDWPLLMAYGGLVDDVHHRRAVAAVAGPTDEELRWATIVTAHAADPASPPGVRG